MSSSRNVVCGIFANIQIRHISSNYLLIGKCVLFTVYRILIVALAVLCQNECYMGAYINFYFRLLMVSVASMS
jgi:hypothetical protein